MNHIEAYKKAYKTSTVTFSITLCVIVASLSYIIFGAKCLTRRRTFIQPKFILILTILLFVAVGSIVWNDYIDKTFDNFHN